MVQYSETILKALCILFKFISYIFKSNPIRKTEIISFLYFLMCPCDLAQKSMFQPNRNIILHKNVSFIDIATCKEIAGCGEGAECDWRSYDNNYHCFCFYPKVGDPLVGCQGSLMSSF